MWYVYVLKSSKNGRHYTGSTNDILRRIHEHNSGQTKYTRSTRPFELIYKEEYNSAFEVKRREVFLKSGQGREFLKKVLIKGR